MTTETITDLIKDVLPEIGRTKQKWTYIDVREAIKADGHKPPTRTRWNNLLNMMAKKGIIYYAGELHETRGRVGVSTAWTTRKELARDSPTVGWVQ